MKTSDVFWQFLPEGLDELFEMVRFEKTEQSYDIWLDEKKKLSDEDYRNLNIIARGYTDYVTIQDILLQSGTSKREGNTTQRRVRDFFKRRRLR